MSKYVCIEQYDGNCLDWQLTGIYSAYATLFSISEFDNCFLLKKKITIQTPGGLSFTSVPDEIISQSHNGRNNIKKKTLFSYKKTNRL
jgi:hypothetical protein